MPSYYIFRKHILPVDIKNTCKYVMTLYENHFKEHQFLLTSYQMDNLIRKKWKRCDVWDEFEICLRVPSMSVQMKAIQSESMDQYWKDLKPCSLDYKVSGGLTFKQVECPICKDPTGFKISLSNCKCIFHKKCIEQAVKYKDTCPVCDCTINKSPVLKNQECNVNEKNHVKQQNQLQ